MFEGKILLNIRSNTFLYLHLSSHVHLSAYVQFFPLSVREVQHLQHQWKILFQQPDSGVHLFRVTCCTSVSHMATCSVNLALVAYHNQSSESNCMKLIYIKPANIKPFELQLLLEMWLWWKDLCCG